MASDRNRKHTVTQLLDVDIDSSEYSFTAEEYMPIDASQSGIMPEPLNIVKEDEVEIDETIVKNDTRRRETVAEPIDVEIATSDSDYVDQTRVDLAPKEAGNCKAIFAVCICIFLLVAGLGVVSDLLINAHGEVSILKVKLASSQEEVSMLKEEVSMLKDVIDELRNPLKSDGEDVQPNSDDDSEIGKDLFQETQINGTMTKMKRAVDWLSVTKREKGLVESL